jgi:hypothetical protein
MTPTEKTMVATLQDRRLRWWYWLATACLLAASLGGWDAGLWITMAFVAAQLAHFLAREGSARAFPVQVRIAYLALLAAGLWSPLGFVHWLQLAGTCASVGLDYCALARIVSLMPWNRTEPLTFQRVWRTFASPPVAGSILYGRPTGRAVPLKQTEQKRPQGEISPMPPLTRLRREPASRRFTPRSNGMTRRSGVCSEATCATVANACKC